ncbi:MULTISPECIES: hypothetical protein [Micromonospora]|uniref:Uncharacterized protein n=1 Tax=Micromonospora fiedleri TaxID=1157498 RepID=A0ABS1USE9_9ACTN|nr:MULTISPECIES: hypothetical protein [Micromonospora]AEB47699.1 hypothetical protein VAB18032_03075 [Micromonospora maris AB-18-032]MBL6278739.1 hypothetical protein [Micromonospora fiedleri]WSK42964.1 hypothetical protein OG712_01870 [Micromonospora maris]
MKILWSLIYFLVFVPVGIFFRLFRDPLRRKWQPELSTYWIFDERPR